MKKNGHKIKKNIISRTFQLLTDGLGGFNRRKIHAGRSWKLFHHLTAA
jgi:hypothetical protein